MRAAAATLLLLALLAAGCDDTVHIRISHGDDTTMAQECNLAVIEMQSFYIELMREDQELILKKPCIGLPGGAGRPTTLSALESLLSGRIVFEEVPSGGQWTIWVEGFITEDCEKAGRAPLLCGKETGVSIPPSGDEIVITVTCVSPKNAWSGEALQSCRFQ